MTLEFNYNIDDWVLYTKTGGWVRVDHIELHKKEEHSYYPVYVCFDKNGFMIKAHKIELEEITPEEEIL